MAEHTVAEPWQVLVKASEAGLIVSAEHDGEDVGGLHLSAHFFGRMPAWEKFTTRHLPTIAASELVEALTIIRETLMKQADSAYVPSLSDLVLMVGEVDVLLAKAEGRA